MSLSLSAAAMVIALGLSAAPTGARAVPADPHPVPPGARGESAPAAVPTDSHRAPDAVELAVPSLELPMDLATGRPVIELAVNVACGEQHRRAGVRVRLHGFIRCARRSDQCQDAAACGVDGVT